MVLLNHCGWRFIVYPILLGVSSVCLFLTILIYSIIPAFRLLKWNWSLYIYPGSTHSPTHSLIIRSNQRLTLALFSQGNIPDKVIYWLLLEPKKHYFLSSISYMHLYFHDLKNHELKCKTYKLIWMYIDSWHKHNFFFFSFSNEHWKTTRSFGKTRKK